jgi:hypothetical protein
VTLIRENLSTFVEWWQYVLGGVYVLTILFLPGGLMAIPDRVRSWRARARTPRETKILQSAPDPRRLS